MRISHRHKFVFLAVPRTGSTAMRRILDPFSDVVSRHRSQIDRRFPFYHHISARELKRVFDERGWDWGSYRKFCVVRNPFDRVVSLYHHRLSPPAKREVDCSLLHRVRTRLTWRLFTPATFKKFVAGLDNTRGLTRSIDHFAFDAAGQRLVDDFLCYERLSHDARAFLRSVGLDVDEQSFPHVNASDGRRQYNEYYDDGCRQRVSVLYRFEIEHFGYRFVRPDSSVQGFGRNSLSEVVSGIPPTS